MTSISSLLGLLELNDGPRPVQHFDFLALPGEIRNKIYLLAISTDPAVLDQQHKYGCSWGTWEPHERQNLMEAWSIRRLPGCNCWTRHRLAILLANRQIHHEAASFFWAENHFMFADIETFMHCVGTALRPQSRQMIPHITIYSTPRNPFLPTWGFWGVLFQCKGLRTLEFPRHPGFKPEFPEVDFPGTVGVSWVSCARLKSELPNLKMVSWSFFTDCAAPRLSPDASLPYGFEYVEYEYQARISKCLDLTTLSPMQSKTYGPLDREEIHFGVNLRERAFPQGQYSPVKGDELVSTGKPDEYRCAAAVVGGQSTPDAAHPETTPMTWIVKRFVVRQSRRRHTSLPYFYPAIVFPVRLP